MKKQIASFIRRWSFLLLIAFVIAGLFYPPIGIVALICMIAPVATGFFSGRYWCGNLCPRGSMNDRLLSKISKRVPVPRFLRSTAFRFAFLALIMAGFALQLWIAWGSLTAIGAVFVRMILITTTIDVLLGAYFEARAWCAICPMGFLSRLAAQSRRKKSSSHIAVNNSCVGCKLCSKACPAGIPVHEYKSIGAVTHADCLRCEKCVEVCPKKALSA